VGHGYGGGVVDGILHDRLMIYTFHGPKPYRREGTRALHEAPWVMIGPLVVLGAGSVLTGLLNLPKYSRQRLARGWLIRSPKPGRVHPGSHALHRREWALLVFRHAGCRRGHRRCMAVAPSERLVPAREAVPESGIAKVLYEILRG